MGKEEGIVRGVIYYTTDLGPILSIICVMYMAVRLGPILMHVLRPVDYIIVYYVVILLLLFNVNYIESN